MAEVSITELGVFQDCMPIVPPDPTGVLFNLDIENTGDGDLSLDVVSATFSDEDGDVATFDTMPASFGPIPAGETAMTMVNKVPDSSMPAAGCSVLSCNQPYTLTVVLSAGEGSEVSAQADGTVSCVF